MPGIKKTLFVLTLLFSCFSSAQVIAADAYEPDDTSFDAKPIVVGDMAGQSHGFHASCDYDFVSFSASAGTSYVLQTFNLVNADTVLRLFSTNGITVLASNDDYSGSASQITWTCPSSGTYFAATQDFSCFYGIGVDYSIRIFIPPPTATPSVTMTVTATPTASPSSTPCSGPIASLPYSQNFEVGSLDCPWSISTSPYGRVRVANFGGWAFGAFELELDSTGAGYGLSEATLRIDASGWNNVMLNFSVIGPYDEIDTLPASFAGSYNGDGVAISQDGVTWHRIWQGNEPSSYQPLSINLSTAMASAGFSNFTDVRIRFIQYDNISIATDGYAYDNISISGAPAGTPTVTPIFSATPSFSVSPTFTVTPTWSNTPVNGIPQAVDAPSLSFATGGANPWFFQTAVSYSGGSAAQAGSTPDWQSSWMETTLIGPGFLNFEWRTSSQLGGDYLRLYIDGVDQGGALSGATTWIYRSISIGSGTHTVRWSYEKNGSVAVGFDTAWVDSVSWTSTGPTPFPAFGSVRPGKIYSYPNPYHYSGGKKLQFIFEPCNGAVITLYDWAASKVGVIPANAVFSSLGYANWDGTLADGSRASPGVYFAILRSDKGVKSCKFTVMP